MNNLEIITAVFFSVLMISYFYYSRKARKRNEKRIQQLEQYFRNLK